MSQIMKNDSIFAISEDILEILNRASENDGYLEPDDEQMLQIRRNDLEGKVISYKGAINYLESDISIANSEIERLSKLIERRNNLIDKLKANLLQALLLFGEEDKKGIKRLKFGTIELATRKNPSSIKVENEDMIDNRFKLIDVKFNNLTTQQLVKLKQCLDQFDLSLPVKEEVKVSKTEIKKAIEAGEKVEYATVEEGKINLVIK